jgi:nucleoside-diphosphate-sugar epimerase
MAKRIFLAGATGVIGRRLVPLLLERGHEVFGATRSNANVAALEHSGARPVVVDAFDAPGVARAVAAADPDVVIHQLTDLSMIHDRARAAEALARNARIRIEGTRNLVAAALAAGARRFIAQSLAWVYAAGREPHVEDDPLDRAATGTFGVTVSGVVALEEAVLGARPMEGLVLRYGWFYGPGANERPAGSPPLHVDAAASAALLAVDRAEPGAYNIAEPGSTVSIEKARRLLGWDPAFRSGAPG